MKIKNKGKVYPSPSPSSSSSSASDGDYLSVLKLLPAAILAIASVLSLEDREVLAYMITISMKTTTTTTTSTTTTKPTTSSIDSKRSKSSKKASTSNFNVATHKPPVFDCDCFECYTSYWFKWDSSPNRELIHQAIEAFEEHLTKGESEKSKKSSRTKRRDKSSRRVADKPAGVSDEPETLMPAAVLMVEESGNSSKDEIVSQEVTVTLTPSSSASIVVGDNNKVLSPENDVALLEKVSEEAERELEVAAEKEEDEEEEMAVTVRTTAVAASNHKGLARKVLPDVLGLFNSRLWSLWGPNV